MVQEPTRERRRNGEDGRTECENETREKGRERDGWQGVRVKKGAGWDLRRGS